MVLKTPIVFLIFRRPELTAKVFDRIREAKPQQLFVVADGPRNEEEAIKCEKARSVTEAIDWDCEVKRNHSPTNLGCKQRVTSGLDWVFSQVDRAIILEDDCLPHPDFFSFCQELLDRYEQDDRVWVITGNNFQNGKKRGNGSYYFSKYNHIWGWATWKRAWEHNEPYIPFWQEWKNSQAWRNHTPDRIERQYWSDIFEQMYERKIDTWDYTWTASVWYGGGLTATPNVNLVTNIGIGPDATHTIVDECQEGIPVEAIGALIHPKEVKQNRKADRYAVDHHFGLYPQRWQYKLLNLPKRMF